MSSGMGRAGRPATGDDPFRLGWRYVRVVGPDGREEQQQVPLTERDLLFPQEGDFVVQADAHIRDWVYLREAFRCALGDRPTIHVFADHRIDFALEDVEPLGPDVAVVEDIEDWDGNRGTLYLAEEGRPLVVVEVTSPETRRNDLGVKIDFYQRAGVPVYVIVDRCAGPNADEVQLGGLYLDAAGEYQTLPRDERGRVWVEPLRLWLGIEQDRVWAYDTAGQRIEEMPELLRQVAEAKRALEEAAAREAAMVAELEHEIEARQHAEATARRHEADRHQAEEARRAAEEQQRQAEEARWVAEEQQRQAEERQQQAEEAARRLEADKQAAQEKQRQAETEAARLAQRLAELEARLAGQSNHGQS